MPKLITKAYDPARPYLSHQVEQMRDLLTTIQFRFDRDTLAFSALALAVAALGLARAAVFDEADGHRGLLKALLGDVGFSLAWLKGRLGVLKGVNGDEPKPLTKLTTGYYQPTTTFQRIEEHTAVMDAETCALIAVTGQAHDPESEAMARLFAAAPALLDACRTAQRALADGTYDAALGAQLRAAIALAGHEEDIRG
jgi:hypothetical protein